MSGNHVLYVSAHNTMFVGMVMKREKLFSTMNSQCVRTHYCLRSSSFPPSLLSWPASGFGISPSEGSILSCTIDVGNGHIACFDPLSCKWQFTNLDPKPWETSPLSTHPQASGITWEEHVWLAHWTKEGRMGDNWKGLEPILKLGANSQTQNQC